jgi:hypothetical protein
MADDEMNQPAIKLNRPAGAPRSSTPVAHWKRWKLRSSILLMVLGALAVIVYLMRSGLAKEYEGLGAALCAIACGGFLVWHAVHLFAEQDRIEEQFDEDEARASSREANPTRPPADAGPGK